MPFMTSLLKIPQEKALHCFTQLGRTLLVMNIESSDKNKMTYQKKKEDLS